MGKRRAILMGLVYIVLLNLAFCSGVQAAPAVVSVSPSSIAASQGDTFTIEIMVDPKGGEIYGAQYDLYFDNILLNASSQIKGTFLSPDGTDTIEVINKINNSIGKVEYGEARIGESGITNSGVLASISFEVTGTSGRGDLKLDDVILSDPNMNEIETEINSGTCTAGKATGEPAVTGITVEEAHQMLEEEPERIILLDVRTEREYKERYIPDAINIPLAGLDSRIGKLDKSKKIIVYSKTGGRSSTASKTLVQNGFEHVYNMLGGIGEWTMYFPVTSLVTPTSAITVTPSPSLTPTPTPTPTPAAGGFEAVIAITGLLAISYLVTKRKS